MRTRSAAGPNTVEDPDRAMLRLLSWSRQGQGLTGYSQAVQAEDNGLSTVQASLVGSAIAYLDDWHEPDPGQQPHPPFLSLHRTQARPLGKGSRCTMCLPNVEEGLMIT